MLKRIVFFGYGSVSYMIFLVQGSLDATGAETNRAFHLCSLLESRAHSVVLAVASDGRCSLVSRRSGCADCSWCAVWVWVGAGVGFYISDQSLRSVRFAPGLAVLARPSIQYLKVRDAGTLSHRTSSAVRRLAVRVLDDSDYDAGASSVRGSDNRIHSARNTVGGAGPRKRAQQSL